jgi:hypothetical protein
MKWLAAVVAAVVLGLPAAAQADERAPNYDRIRRALQRSVAAPVLSVTNRSIADMAPVRQQRAQVSRPRDSVWNGALIGAGIGGVGGYIWARNICGSNDPECFAIAAPVGVLVGAGIGAVVGAVADALNK